MMTGAAYTGTAGIPADAAVEVKRLGPEDAPGIASLEAACFSDAWSEKALREELDSRLSLYLGLWQEKALVGYIGTRLVLDEGEIHRVAVLPSCRRRGYAALLMQALRESTEDIIMWNLEVRESNLAAQNLYRRYGFETIGFRRNYYHDPVENGIMMQWNR